MRRLVGVLVVSLLAGGGIAAAAEDGPPTLPEPLDQLGSPWFADPTNPPAPAGLYHRATYEAPDAVAMDPNGAGGAPSDLPPGIPKVATQPEPKLPDAAGWGWGDRFPRTSGTGRYYAGAYFWSDFIYDDNGAIGVPPPTNESTGAPSPATYKYPDTRAAGNGADIFRVGIGRAGDETTWRVDWNTLVDPEVPLAVFTIDSDADPATGVEAWPANANLESAGIDRALVVSSKGAWWYDLTQPGSAPLAVENDVDLAARSFVATTPNVDGDEAIIRVAAGLADAEGDALLTLTPAHGALPGQPNVYNVAFRGYDDEAPYGNSWFDSAQTQALTSGGDVSEFAATVAWDELNPNNKDDEPLLPGYTNRWYVSSQEFGQGIGTASAIGTSDPPLYLGRVQPYGIFVPSTYAPDDPSALTWLLHGATSSQNSAQVQARFLESACERLDTICVTPLGRGPNGGWRNYAELDFWEVWNRVAATYSLDADRTVLTGISMGAFGTYKIAMDHPEAFAAAVTIVGHANNAEAGLDRLENLRWIPLYARHGTFDQLVPITEELKTQQELDRLGLRHVFDYQVVEDHVAVALKDGYDDVAEYLAGVGEREDTPARILYAWDESVDPEPAPGELEVPLWKKRKTLGLVRTGAYWLDGVRARNNASRARISAQSFAIEDPAVNVTDRYEPRVLASPSPAVRHVMEWLLGDAPDTEQRATLELENVGEITIDVDHARLAAGAPITVLTDGPVTVRLAHGDTVYRSEPVTTSGHIVTV